MPNLALKHALIDYEDPAYKVAARMGVSHSVISKFISGIQLPTNEQKKELSMILGKKVIDIFPPGNERSQG